MKTRNTSRAFALPTVLIISIIMLSVLVSAVSSTSSTRVALMNQHYDELSRQAADAGVVYAKACMAANSGTPQWSDVKPLKPNTDCSGDQMDGFTCPENSIDSRCAFNVIDDSIIVSFSVSKPLQNSIGEYTNISSKGSVVLLRKSDNSVWRSFSGSVKEANFQSGNSNIPLALSSGSGSSCLLSSDGKVYCWGGGLLGTGMVKKSSLPVAIDSSGVLNNLSVKQLSVGNISACVIASDNHAYCWGDNGYGQLGNNSTTSSSVPVAVLSTGALSGLTIKSISVGGTHACAIASDDKAYCWGGNGYGQLGNNSTTSSSVPVAVLSTGALSGLTIKSISVGGTYTCAIASDDNAYCWGQNNGGQLGDGTVANKIVPAAVYRNGALSGLTVKSISSGFDHSCLIASNNNAYCWGGGYYGQLGNNSTSSTAAPYAVYRSGVISGLSIISISAGKYATCAIASNNKSYCWGSNGVGQLGNGLNTNSSVPVTVDESALPVGSTFKAISVGDRYACAILSSNSSYCWGFNLYGALGTNSIISSAIPISIDSKGVFDGLSIRSISAGVYSSSVCAIASDSKLYCWGQNYNGSLGNGSITIASASPVSVVNNGVLNGLTAEYIAEGAGHACTIASNNLAYCWGDNDYGQLGNSSTADSSVPVAVLSTGALSGLTIKSISAGGFQTCAIASNDKAYCWGRNSDGQLGNNSTTSSSVPVAVLSTGALSGLTIKSISVGSTHTCAIASNDKVYCWGANSKGGVGDGTASNRLAPVAVYSTGVLSGLNIKSISAGGYDTCAIASNDKVYCWGDNEYGKLGYNSTSIAAYYPVAVYDSGVLSGLSINSINVGGTHTCVIASNNQVYCWGRNDEGQLGNNTLTDSKVPMLVDNSGVLNGKTIQQVYNGSGFSCALSTDGRVFCWGLNHAGQLCNGLLMYYKPTESVYLNGIFGSGIKTWHSVSF